MISTAIRHVPLSASDYTRLLAASTQQASYGCNAAVKILKLLEHALVCDGDKLSQNMVQLDTFVTYSLDDQSAQTCLLILPENSYWPAAELSVFTTIGYELLGRSAGDRISLHFAGRNRLLLVAAVPRQSQYEIPQLN